MDTQTIIPADGAGFRFAPAHAAVEFVDGLDASRHAIGLRIAAR